jgi:hypothetical protein
LTPVGKLISHSPCKNEKLADIATDIPDTQSCINYSFDVTAGKLYIAHINAGFNCCPESLYCTISIENDTLIIEEHEEMGLCNCDCLFDLEIEINEIGAGKYPVKIIEPYSYDQEKLDFTIDLAVDPAGSYCVTRNQYPWGQSLF